MAAVFVTAFCYRRSCLRSRHSEDACHDVCGGFSADCGWQRHSDAGHWLLVPPPARYSRSLRRSAAMPQLPSLQAWLVDWQPVFAAENSEACFLLQALDFGKRKVFALRRGPLHYHSIADNHCLCSAALQGRTFGGKLLCWTDFSTRTPASTARQNTSSTYAGYA